MIIAKNSHEIITITPDPYELIETAGRTCYKSEPLGDPTKFVRKIVNSGHHSVIEHVNVTVRFICDRGVSHELVRHRIASYCLSGDTELIAHKARTGYSAKKWTIAQLFEWQSDPKRKGRIKLIRLRSVNSDGIIIPGKIKRVINSGELEDERSKF